MYFKQCPGSEKKKKKINYFFCLSAFPVSTLLHVSDRNYLYKAKD